MTCYSHECAVHLKERRENRLTMSNQIRAAEFLRKAAEALDAEISATTTTTSCSTVTAPSTIGSAIRSIFTPYNRSNYRPANPRNRTRREPISYWSHRFCLLASSKQITAPTREEKQELYDAGLGEKKITFIKDSYPESFKAKLEEVYPNLIGCGGFELLRSNCGSRVSLEVLKMPSTGFTSIYLANESNLGQALCYIRPIQKDLELHIGSTQEHSEPTESDVTEQCIDCNQMIPLSSLRSHKEICNRTQVHFS
ncbi:uncharacterized protein LOC123545143 [Mercenaria mercenaria]|uniref:uncharacterized protein LOC123545143 n=1 Tax=Mercenaria mercenaria TaxID=6596 RepID=UPI00234F96E9|nr:uncharacterized protein LOC123545143 [Mercenaria mercenaria]